VARKITGEAGEAGEDEANNGKLVMTELPVSFRGKIDPDIVILV
jgi:hypothetical protein